MACCSETNLTPQEIFGVSPDTPCTSIGIDLLKVYQRPIDCYLKYKLWETIESTELELQNATEYLQGLIDQKTADPNDCRGIEILWLVRVLVDRIIKRGVCL